MIKEEIEDSKRESKAKKILILVDLKILFRWIMQHWGGGDILLLPKDFG